MMESERQPLNVADPEGQDKSQEATPKCAGFDLRILVGLVIAVIVALVVWLDAANKMWACDPYAPPSIFGDAFFPNKLTLDETPSRALGWLGGARVDVLNGFEPQLRSTFPLIGFFCEVWSWFSRTYGYVEQTLEGTQVLRFTASQPWALFWHPPHTIKYCETPGYSPSPSYQIERASYFDGTMHNIYEVPPNGDRQLVATADHRMEGVDVGASFFVGLSVNTAWRLVIQAADTEKTLLAEARQWYDHNPIANYGASNWAVQRRPDNATLPAGVRPVPQSVVAYTAALYDLSVGSDRRRRSSSSFSRRRR